MKLEMLLGIVLIALGCVIVFADPEPGNVVQAQGGNLTPLFISTGGAGGASTRWQGYWGNVSGGIALEDAYNHTLYSWDLPEPSGEVFASNWSTVTWSKIDCVNFSTNTSVLKYNVSDLNLFLGLGPSQQGARDSINATFNQTFGDDGNTFAIGSRNFNNADNCSMVTLNNATGYQTAKFQEVLLTDNHSIVFTALMYPNERGFNNETLDFQMIVGLNDSTTLRNYYFFVELS